MPCRSAMQWMNATILNAHAMPAWTKHIIRCLWQPTCGFAFYIYVRMYALCIYCVYVCVPLQKQGLIPAGPWQISTASPHLVPAVDRGQIMDSRIGRMANVRHCLFVFIGYIQLFSFSYAYCYSLLSLSPTTPTTTNYVEYSLPR